MAEKSPQIIDDYEYIRKRRDEIAQQEGKPVERQPPQPQHDAGMFACWDVNLHSKLTLEEKSDFEEPPCRRSGRSTIYVTFPVEGIVDRNWLIDLSHLDGAFTYPAEDGLLHGPGAPTRFTHYRFVTVPPEADDEPARHQFRHVDGKDTGIRHRVLPSGMEITYRNVGIDGDLDD
jgi:hypothetical protein